MILNLAETSAAKSRPSVMHGANILPFGANGSYDEMEVMGEVE